ncbi:hypothetical protein VM1G_10791 [Cytospora mali]|uniref:PLD phosphodiesterase domain-containing protein n=1 Tax=Cytospora mali TaxID=578113 RepID=A0A194VJG2_CYTMA|nr:hypothetical protein VM1G_10791 [Valsa mali]
MESFTVGTGASIYTQKLLPAILTARHEIILVTCFWAPSKTLTALCDALQHLARQRQADGAIHPLRMSICFSSRSLFQKLFHTSSVHGCVYSPSAWTSKMGLPSPEALASGNIELGVKSLFFLPFSVMHPKFLVVDRQRAFVPSCNVSWEAWFEGCLEISRKTPHHDPIDGLLGFYRTVWDNDFDLDAALPEWPDEQDGSRLSMVDHHVKEIIQSPAHASIKLVDIGVPSSAIEWLPGWHHRNPSLCFLPWQTPPAPDTPLNNTLLRLFEEASRNIYIQTPNLTSPPVLSAIVETLARGVDVAIVTSQGMMLLEQLLTASTTTSWCIRSLTRRYRQMCSAIQARTNSQAQSRGDGNVDLEAQTITPGLLTVSYFRSRSGSTSDEEPVHSHLKLSIFDGERTVLGSGNMDRASWFTSQELGILVQGASFAAAIKSTVDRALDGRVDPVFTITS